jgi:hypothetical protein
MKKIILIVLVLLGLKPQAQTMYCDSISYDASTTLNYPITLSGNSTGIPGTVTWNWTVCNATLCYSSSGTIANFNQVSLTDILKVCYDVTIDINGVIYMCSKCDTLIYNPNTYQWELSQPHPVSIEEVKYVNYIDNGKIYDLFGRELNAIPSRKMYIRNNRLCVSP